MTRGAAPEYQMRLCEFPTTATYTKAPLPMLSTQKGSDG
eukprot:CAMPEP_0180739054 /NCGR_PEP_ID=MMETSP1038_2-20121128/25138_1 /TAXON_ID=632150 /ORGANISM="Azadinium spinosum, Strain 3D9" /LENGTH=38 /DNA_ID= /DNA_START= /DNA_END= /DNA_ORIENTATION=